jgi:hypothetical protein
MEEVFSACWYQHNVRSSTQAEECLAGTPIGSFLVRPSLTNPTREPFTVSYMALAGPLHTRSSSSSPPLISFSPD